jgi:UDP-glucose 4-epimerase
MSFVVPLDNLAGKAVLVTGGAGFVGSNLVRRLVALGARVTVLDNFVTGDTNNLRGVDGPRLVQGSVTDPELLQQLIKEMDIVVHAAARNIIVSTRNPREDFETNIGGTLNVLLATRGTNVQRVVYTSSASIYGNSRHLPINEDDQPYTLSPYAVSKFAGENYCLAFYESYGIPTAVVRYSNVYGPGQSPSNPYCGVISKFFQAAVEGKPISIHGDGQQTRDFTFVEDTVEATLLAALSPRAVGEVLNIGTGFETDVNTLAQTIAVVTGKAVPILHVDRRDIDNIRRRVLNIEKIRRVLHWVPRHTLRQGLEKTWQWMCSR